MIFRAGSPVNEIGLVESGSVNIVVNLYWGNSIIFGHVGKGEVFAENYAAIPGKELVCDVVACEKYPSHLSKYAQYANYVPERMCLS